MLEPIYDLYLSSVGPAGSLGLPTSDEFVLASGVHRQTFEGGALEYTPGGNPVVRPPVASVVLAGASAASVTLPLGSTLTITATPYTATGIALSDRAISWSTSNGSVIAIQASAATAVLRAIGGFERVRRRARDSKAALQWTLEPLAGQAYFVSGLILARYNILGGATGNFGMVSKQGAYFVTTAPVTVVLNGTEFSAVFSGLTPGFTCLYQVNVVFPSTTPPGQGISLTLKQGGQLSNPVNVSLQ